MIQKYLDKWDLKISEKLTETHTSEIYKVHNETNTFIIKLLNEKGKEHEGESPYALKCFDGHGSAKIFDFDENALLLEFVDGKKLSSVVHEGKDHEASNIICDVLEMIHENRGDKPKKLHNLERQFESLFKINSKKNCDHIFKKGLKVAEYLIGTEKNKALLHGDIHHFNILRSSKRGWLVIDPQSFYAEKTYDVANSFFNPDDLPSLVETEERILKQAEIFSNRLGVERKRILQFAYAHGALSCAWSLEDGDSPNRRLRINPLIEKFV